MIELRWKLVGGARKLQYRYRTPLPTTFPIEEWPWSAWKEVPDDLEDDKDDEPA